jgi:hypothetical protein
MQVGVGPQVRSLAGSGCLAGSGRFYPHMIREMIRGIPPQAPRQIKGEGKIVSFTSPSFPQQTQVALSAKRGTETGLELRTSSLICRGQRGWANRFLGSVPAGEDWPECPAMQNTAGPWLVDTRLTHLASTTEKVKSDKIERFKQEMPSNGHSSRGKCVQETWGHPPFARLGRLGGWEP